VLVKVDLCDLTRKLRADYFAKDRDVTLATSRKLVLADGTEVPSSALVPIGGIIIWSGAVGAIPANWQICDGTNGTPDLRNRFVIGAGDTYAVDATGGSATKDLSHTHAVGTLAAANESAHTHGIGSYAAANESSHTHGDGSYATNNDSHSHTSGTLATDTEPVHYHAYGTLTIGSPSDTTDYGTTPGGPGKATDTHVHYITGNTAGDGDHSHSVNSGSTAGDTHSHDVTGTSGTGSAHTHSLSGTSGTGSAHTHSLSGSTATGGSAAQDVLNPYYALAFIMRLS